MTQQQNGDLLYVVNVGDSTVGVYQYPSGHKAATLAGFSHPEGACTDTAGHVFIANTGAHDIVVFAHGGAHPQRTLSEGSYHPANCAVDPRTGNLAVANNDVKRRGYGGSIAIYQQGRGTPQYFTSLHSYISCAYDDRSNLFAIGELGDNYYLQELPKGGGTLETVPFENVQGLRYVGWDGEDVTEEVPKTNWSVIYRVKIADGRAHLQSVTTVSRKGTAFFDRPRVIVTGQSAIALFDYPSGSGPTRKVFDYRDPVASVVSRAI